MGPLSGSVHGRGLYQHTALAVEASSRRVLGILDQRWWVRAEKTHDGETRRQRQALRRFDIFAAPFDQRGAAHGACVVRPLHRHQRGDDLAQALTQERQQHQRD